MIARLFTHLANRGRRFGAIALLACCGCSVNSRGPTIREDARRLILEGRPEEAIPILSSLRAKAPGDLDVARALVDAHVRSGRVESLIAALSSPSVSHTAATHYMLGLAHFARSRDFSMLAIRELEAAIAIDPGLAELHHRLGLVFLELGQPDSASRCLERALKGEPANPRILLSMATARHRAGDSAGAIGALRELVGFRPARAEVIAARSLMDRIDNPFARLPEGIRGRLESGLQYLNNLDSPQQAIASFEEGAREHPDCPIVHTLLALAYQRLDDAGRAMDELHRAIDLEPDGGANHLYLAELYLSRQKSIQARDSLQRAVELNPLLDEAYLHLGELALEGRDLPSARRHFQIATSLVPDSRAARGKLALVLQLEGDYAGADQQLREVLRTDPGNVEFMLRLGVLHLENRTRAPSAGDRRRSEAEAARWLREVLKAEPENAIASRGLQSMVAR